MNLKPQDILFLLKLIAINQNGWSFNKLALELGMSPAEVHAAAKRSVVARLAVNDDGKLRPNVRNLEEFFLHGIQYVFVPDRGRIGRGMPTSYASKYMDKYFAPNKELPPVWPDPQGEARGEAFSPLYRSVPVAAKNDSKLYELLALLDAIRGGRVRESDIAKKAMVKKLRRYGQNTKP